MQQRKVSVMGIINVNGDSFYAGSRCSAQDFAERFQKMVSEEADIIDIGACSTKPGSTPVSLEQEWENLKNSLGGSLELVSEFKGDDPTRISIDTFRAQIVRRCHDLIGPFMVNDISAGEDDAQMLSTVAELGLPYIAMHKRGTPNTMQSLCDYPNGVVNELCCYFSDFCSRARQAGIKEIVVDPGFGFAKSVEQNYELIWGLSKIKEDASAAFGSEVPLLAALSRKSMLWRPLGITPDEALPATVAIHLQCLLGGADMIRVHDVPEGIQCRRLFELLCGK